MNLAQRRAYDAAVECAALCMIALASVDGDSFRLHMRDALREALHLRGAVHADARRADAAAAHKVREDVVARLAAICARDCTPVSNADGAVQIDKHADRLLHECLHALLMPVGGLCLSEA
jgi:hypothetical protein